MMSSNDRKKQKENLILYSSMAIMFGLGYYFMEHVSTWEDPILGNTFYIVIGGLLMAVPFVVLIKKINDNYKMRKRAKSKISSRRRIFLDERKSSHN